MQKDENLKSGGTILFRLGQCKHRKCSSTGGSCFCATPKLESSNVRSSPFDDTKCCPCFFWPVEIIFRERISQTHSDSPGSLFLCHSNTCLSFTTYVLHHLFSVYGKSCKDVKSKILCKFSLQKGEKLFAFNTGICGVFLCKVRAGKKGQFVEPITMIRPTQWRQNVLRQNYQIKCAYTCPWNTV